MYPEGTITRHGSAFEISLSSPYHSLKITNSRVPHREDAEHDQRDHFLCRLELRCRKFIVPDPVGRHLETILDESNPPADEITIHKGESLYLRCPYQAKVMKVLETVSSRIVCIDSLPLRNQASNYLQPARIRSIPQNKGKDVLNASLAA